MNLEEIKLAGQRLSLEAEVSRQLRQLETAYKAGNYAAAWQNADNITVLLKALIAITPHEKAKTKAISIDDLDERVSDASAS